MYNVDATNTPAAVRLCIYLCIGLFIAFPNCFSCAMSPCSVMNRRIILLVNSIYSMKQPHVPVANWH